MDSFISATKILSLARFKANASEVLNGIKRDGHPVVITKNGDAAAVLVAPEEYDRLFYRASFISAIEQGYADSESGHTVDSKIVAAEFDRRYRRQR